MADLLTTTNPPPPRKGPFRLSDYWDALDKAAAQGIVGARIIRHPDGSYWLFAPLGEYEPGAAPAGG